MIIMYLLGVCLGLAWLYLGGRAVYRHHERERLRTRIGQWPTTSGRL